MMANRLMDLEMEILESIPVSGTLAPKAYAVWADRDGEIQMGPLRGKRVQSGGECAGTYYSASPFPGAWVEVREEQMRRVRNLGALSLAGMACVCQGTVWDVHCPSERCTTAPRI